MVDVRMNCRPPRGNRAHPHDEYGSRAAPHDALRHGTHDEVPQATAAVSADDDQVGRVTRGKIQNLAYGIARQNRRLDAVNAVALGLSGGRSAQYRGLIKPFL